MKTNFYPKLARDSIRKNRKRYFPYILTGAVMVMMFYILSFLKNSPALDAMEGGTTLRIIMPLGCMVIGIFSLLFLFYTNSFLIRQRYQEFGLYNVLGMDKKNISRLMAWEVGYTGAITIAAGIACGIIMSKAAELMLINILNMDVNYDYHIDISAAVDTILVYLIIYVILLMSSVIKVKRSKPLELVQSSRVGEKKPKCNWVLALAGIILVGWAYYLAVTIKEPMKALYMFFIAVLMVIAGTYLLFISGSVALCKLLQKKKSYYYKPQHFVSVSSMAYRMKRNGAGLATICILLTMVLVMISSTATLYFSSEESIANRYPNSVNAKLSYKSLEGVKESNVEILRGKIAEIAPQGTDLTGTKYVLAAGMFTDEGLILETAHAESVDYDKVGYLYILSIDDYNRAMNDDRSLGEGECFLYSSRLDTEWESFTVEYCDTYKVKERLSEFNEDGDSMALIAPCVYVIVNDMEDFIAPVVGMKNSSGYSMVDYEWKLGIDCEKDEEAALRIGVEQVILGCTDESQPWEYYYVESREEQRFGFYEIYGGLFFLGIMLSFVFVIAAVLIIYYKQISEGYEDQRRFEIMQKVGMTKGDIRRSINSQMLTVFFLPLVTAGIHLAFAFPFISKLLLMFAFNNTVLNIGVTAICFAAFGVLYGVVYKVTSGSYYGIVSGGNISGR